MRFLSIQDFEAHKFWCSGQSTEATTPEAPSVTAIDTRFPCFKCGRVFRWKHSLTQHIKFECGKEPQFQCPHCPHKTKLKNNLRKHIWRRHGIFWSLSREGAMFYIDSECLTASKRGVGTPHPRNELNFFQHRWCNLYNIINKHKFKVCVIVFEFIFTSNVLACVVILSDYFGGINYLRWCILTGCLGGVGSYVISNLNVIEKIAVRKMKFCDYQEGDIQRGFQLLSFVLAN